MNKYSVIRFQSPFERLNGFSIVPEIRLYKAIITQAIIDVSNISNAAGSKKIALEAKNWLFGNSPYFIEVCHRAELPPENVRQIAKEAISLCTNSNSYLPNSQKKVA